MKNYFLIDFVILFVKIDHFFFPSYRECAKVLLGPSPIMPVILISWTVCEQFLGSIRSNSRPFLQKRNPAFSLRKLFSSSLRLIHELFRCYCFLRPSPNHLFSAVFKDISLSCLLIVRDSQYEFSLFTLTISI